MSNIAIRFRNLGVAVLCLGASGCIADHSAQPSTGGAAPSAHAAATSLTSRTPLQKPLQRQCRAWTEIFESFSGGPITSRQACLGWVSAPRPLAAHPALMTASSTP